MKHGEYIWQSPHWPEWQYDLAALAKPLAEVSRAQGLLLGRLADVGMALRDEASLAALTDDVVQTSAIEGEILNVASVRSSVARRLGVDIGALAPADRHVDGIVDMVFDATSNANTLLTKARLFGWHAALFPTGYSGMSPIRVARWRDDTTGPMQVVSGAISREKVHFEAPPAERLDAEVTRFLSWVNERRPKEPALVRAGLGHLWFVTLHPFDDGNGRIARAIGDLLLTRADGSPQRFYSLSAQIQRERKEYYDNLERTQKGDTEVTAWLQWFLATLLKAVEQAHTTLDQVLAKVRFWQWAAAIPMNERQIKVLNRLLDGFEGKLTTSKWATLAKCSQDTALRDITELLQHQVLQKSASGGRSTHYEIRSLRHTTI
ncbi:Fic family protein [Neopusillimonas maritima]|uniref:Cell filamentation protein Fic n=1 Tax=Neopusillimonas maritima TaxID=2026239 RepID=A0A3A1YV69_9BURK|nr:Fic family protein [Neopusillimonas maritima]RIY41179.1 cell filamentation protein Fic [Neopusillimonas maritima]